MLRALFGQRTCARVLFDQNDYYGGEVMSGRVIMSVADASGIRVDAIFLRLRGHEKTSFDVTRTRTERDSNGQTRTVSYTERVGQDIAFLRRDFVLFAQNATFLPGEYVFPFTLALDANIPATFRLGQASGGSAKAALWYDATAEISVPGTFTPNIRESQEFIVKDALQTPLASLAAQEERDVTFLCCMSRGSVSVHASLLKNAYGPGEVVQARVTIDGTKSQVDLDKISVKLACDVSLRANSHAHSTSRTLAKTGAAGMKAGESTDRVLDMLLPLEVPPSTRGQLITCSFYVVIELAVPWSPNVRMRIPVQIHAPPRVVQMLVLPPQYVPTSTMPVVDLSKAPLAPVVSAEPLSAEPPAYTAFAGGSPSAWSSK